jgi:hypothetical protein
LICNAVSGDLSTQSSKSVRSISDDESVEILSLGVLITDHAIIATLDNGATFHFQKGTQVLEQFNLQGIVLTIVLDVSLVVFKILNDVLLLSQLCIEEL